MPHSTETLLVDIGNSALKCVSWNPTDKLFLTNPCRRSWRDLGDAGLNAVDDCLRNQLARNAGAVRISSVNQRYTEEVIRFLATYGAANVQVVRFDDVPMQVHVDEPERLGVDRLLAAFAAWSMFGSQREPLLVLQIGTAITIDLVSGDGGYQGGVILPSESTLYLSLAERTAQLPLLQPLPDRLGIDEICPGEILQLSSIESVAKPSSLPGKNTSEAMRLGVSACIWGGVADIYQRYCHDQGRELAIIATGGGAADLAANMSLPMKLVSNLVLKGLSILS